jgi:8-oxo-dGTP pyrophosphatase MutT (NUDIX family)
VRFLERQLPLPDDAGADSGDTTRSGDFYHHEQAYVTVYCRTACRSEETFDTVARLADAIFTFDVPPRKYMYKTRVLHAAHLASVDRHDRVVLAIVRALFDRWLRWLPAIPVCLHTDKFGGIHVYTHDDVATRPTGGAWSPSSSDSHLSDDAILRDMRDTDQDDADRTDAEREDDERTNNAQHEDKEQDDADRTDADDDLLTDDVESQSDVSVAEQDADQHPSDQDLLLLDHGFVIKWLARHLVVWQRDRRCGVWLHVPMRAAALVPMLQAHLQFRVHHADDSAIVLTRWLLTDEACRFPSYGTHVANVGLVITRSIRERHSPDKRYKFPSGTIERGETFREAAAREMFEETGLRGDAQSVVGLWNCRSTKSSYGCNLLFILVRMTCHNAYQPIRLQTDELLEAAWIDESQLAHLPIFRGAHGPMRRFLHPYVWRRDGLRAQTNDLYL